MIENHFTTVPEVVVLNITLKKPNMSSNLAYKEILPEIYLWILPILSVPVLYGIRISSNLEIFIGVVIVHLIIIWLALWSLTSSERIKPNKLVTITSVLLISGAAFTFISATTFPTTSLDAIFSDKFGHYWTSIGFFISELFFLSGMTYLGTYIEKSDGKSSIHKIGYLLIISGGILWLIHLSFRVTAMVWAADEKASSGVVHNFYEATELWASSLYVCYMVLTYLGVALYGIALKKSGFLPKWLTRSTILFGFSASVLFVSGIGPFGMPIIIQLAPWLIGIFLLKSIRVDSSS